MKKEGRITKGVRMIGCAYATVRRKRVNGILCVLCGKNFAQEVYLESGNV